MSERTYLVAIDAWNTNHDVSSVKDFIRDSPVISDWWNYIPYVFLLVSPLSADQLNDALKPYTKDAGLLVIEAKPSTARGLLPNTAWKWLDNRTKIAQEGHAAIGALGGFSSANGPTLGGTVSQAAPTDIEKH